MDSFGLNGKYPVNRPITDEERRRQLKQNQRISGKPLYQRSVIKVNSTYLEMVDKFYGWRGYLTTIALFGMILGCFLGVTIILQLLMDYHGNADLAKNWPYLFGFGLLLYLSFLLTRAILRAEAFNYTHFPMRFNRENRMVYIFRPGLSGEVFSAPWDDIHFCINTGDKVGYTTYEVQGLVLNEHDIVQEGFSLSDYGDKSSFDTLRLHWELVRRYMEEGPDEVIPYIQSYLPLHERKETFYEGFSRFMSDSGGHIITLPLAFLMYVTIIIAGRNFGVLVNKIPQWPQWVEDECKTKPNDPNWRDYKTHPWERDWDKDDERTVPANQPLYPNAKPKPLWFGVDPLVAIAGIVPWVALGGAWLAYMWL